MSDSIHTMLRASRSCRIGSGWCVVLILLSALVGAAWRGASVRREIAKKVDSGDLISWRLDYESEE
jgi:hypothetical protein